MDSGLTLALSIVIGSIFLLTIMEAQQNLHEMKVQNQLMSIAQDRINHVKDVLGTDIDRTGQNIDDDDLSGGYFVAPLDSFHLTMLQNINGTGLDVDTVKYWVGDVSDLSHTDNPEDRILYRQVNDGPVLEISEGITYFNFKGKKKNGADAGLAEIDQVRAVEVKAIYETGYAYGEWLNPYINQIEPHYFQAEWTTLICPDNLGWYN